jgi:hypothetical protein
MIETFSLHVYWGPREQSAEERAKSILDTLQVLSDWDDSFHEWYDKGETLEDAKLRKIDYNFVLNITKLGENVLGMWNGADDEEKQGSVSFNTGRSNPTARNSVSIEFPYNKFTKIFDKSLLITYIKKLVLIFNPDYLMITNQLQSDLIEKHIDKNPYSFPSLCYLTYIKQDTPYSLKIPLLADKVTLFEVAGFGTILQPKEYPFSIQDTALVEICIEGSKILSGDL